VWQRVCCSVNNGHTALLITHTQKPAAVTRLLWRQAREAHAYGGVKEEHVRGLWGAVNTVRSFWFPCLCCSQRAARCQHTTRATPPRPDAPPAKHPGSTHLVEGD
jgi:hypothetical protein